MDAYVNGVRDVAPAPSGAELTDTLFFGNLSYQVGEVELAALVGSCCAVCSAHVLRDRVTRRSRGFAFVEVPAGAADAVIDGLHGRMLHGRSIIVNHARPREARPR